MDMTVVRQAQIKTSDDFNNLRIVDWNRWGHGNLASATLNLPNWLIGSWYTILAVDLSQEPLRDGFDWRHVGEAHHDLGHRYWSFFKRMFPNGEIDFSDAPDFSGYFQTAAGDRREFIGDIGTVSASAFFLNSMPLFREGTLWISVEERRQIIIEAAFDINEVMHARMEALLGLQ